MSSPHGQAHFNYSRSLINSLHIMFTAEESQVMTSSQQVRLGHTNTPVSSCLSSPVCLTPVQLLLSVFSCLLSVRPTDRFPLVGAPTPTLPVTKVKVFQEQTVILVKKQNRPDISLCPLYFDSPCFLQMCYSYSCEYITDATVQVAHGTVRTSIFEPRFWFVFGTCFVHKENNFFSPKLSLYFT